MPYDPSGPALEALRERVLHMAHDAFARGVLNRADILALAREYESYLRGEPAADAAQPLAPGNAERGEPAL